MCGFVQVYFKKEHILPLTVDLRVFLEDGIFFAPVVPDKHQTELQYELA